MAQITYTNKVALNENPEIANINKVTDDDMNEIKSVVNANYNNTIQITNTQPSDNDNKIWIDTGEIASASSEITNSYSTSTGLGYSANYVNNNVGVVDSGSNENGNYVKFADGTLIQYGATNMTTGTQSYSSGYTHYGVTSNVTLPTSFIDTNYTINANANAPMDYITNINVNRGSTSQFEIRFQSSQSNYTRLIYWIAIGRWK